MIDVDPDSLPGCANTLIEAFISISVFTVLFLMGFALSGVAIVSIKQYKERKIHWIFKLIFLLNIIIFWVVYLLGICIHYYCYQVNVEKTQIYGISPTYVIIFELVFMGLIISQLIIIQINSIERTHCVFSSTKYPLQTKPIIISILLTIVSTILLFLTTIFYYGSFIPEYSYIRKYMIASYPAGLLCHILADLNMLCVFVKTLFKMVTDSKIMTKQKSKTNEFISDKTVQPSLNTLNTLNTKKSSCTITPLNDQYITPPIIQNDETPPSVQHQRNTLLISKTDHTLMSLTAVQRSSGNQDISHMQLTKQMNRIIGSISKLITITLFNYIILCIPLILCILLSKMIIDDKILTLIAGYMFLLYSLYFIFYMYLHFSFSDSLYYNKMICCVKCDNKIKHKVSQMVEQKKFNENDPIESLLLRERGPTI